LVAITYGCVKDEQRFSGRVENKCLDDGSYYVEACGPRTTNVFSYVPLSTWKDTYTRHRDFDTKRTQEFAGMFEQLVLDSGGAANAFTAQNIANSWFKRDVSLGENGRDQAAPFYRAVCQAMRENLEVDTGPGFSNYSEGSLNYLTSLFLYES
jgi:hypothetical protein